MTFGHRSGDQLLQNLANTIQTKAPPGSAIGRLTSDEFIVLIPHFNWDQTRQLAKELLDLRAFAQAENEESLNRHCSLCLSAIEGSETLSDALKTADIGLKKPKRSAAVAGLKPMKHLKRRPSNRVPISRI